MKRCNEVSANDDLYARINAMPMNAREREVAFCALRNADAIADCILWVTNGLRRLSARVFTKPAGLQA